MQGMCNDTHVTLMNANWDMESSLNLPFQFSRAIVLGSSFSTDLLLFVHSGIPTTQRLFCLSWFGRSSILYLHQLTSFCWSYSCRGRKMTVPPWKRISASLNHCVPYVLQVPNEVLCCAWNSIYPGGKGLTALSAIAWAHSSDRVKPWLLSPCLNSLL